MAQRWDARFVRGAPDVVRLTRGFADARAGALVVLAPCARDVALRVTALAGARRVFDRALKAGRGQGAVAARIHHGRGRIPAGRPMVAIAALAHGRKDAVLAAEIMLNTLKGVASRRDESSA